MEAFLAHCSAAFSGHGNLFLVFFIGGLTGSLTHCLTMCGPVVACQAACGGACGKKLSTASQWQYHGGRLLTYSALGFLSSVFSRQLASYAFWPALSSAMLVTAGILFIGSGIFPSQHRIFFGNAKNAFLRGSLMGFMPCGLLYAALMMAATIANPIASAAAMACFVFGTMPVLMTASTSAALLAQKWQHSLNRIGRIGLTFNGLTLLALAAKLAR